VGTTNGCGGTIGPVPAMPHEETPDRLRRLPSWLTSRAQMRSARLVNERLALAGSDRRDYALLSALDQYGPTSQATLARRCNIDPSDAVAVMNDLEARRLASRRRDPVDRRRNTVEVTPEGLALLDRLDTLVTEAQEDYLAPLSPAERERFTALLAKVVGEPARPASGTPPPT